MKTIKLELSVKILLGAIALGLFLNTFKDFPPKANASEVQKVILCDATNTRNCAKVFSNGVVLVSGGVNK